MNFIRRRVNVNADDVQARLARERAEWQRQAELRHQERMRILREEILASQKRYQDSLAQTELRYQEKMKAIEEELRLNREAERAVEEQKPEGTYTLVDEMLSDLRRRHPEWEVRRQTVQRVSSFVWIPASNGLNLWLPQETNGTDEQPSIRDIRASMTRKEEAIVPVLYLVCCSLLYVVIRIFNGYLFSMRWLRCDSD